MSVATTLSGKRILITGGAGFIGSNLAQTLIHDNEVVVVDNGKLGIKENVPDAIEYHEQSILEDDLPTNVDIVFHLAARTPSANHLSDTCQGVRVNVEGFVSVVRQALEKGCDQVIYDSSSCLYGDSSDMSPDEADVSLNSPFGASLAAREAYAEYFANHHGLQMAGIRLFSVYQEYGRTKGREQEYANIVAQIAADIATGRPPVLPGNGNQARDFIHVDDVVRGLIAAASHQLEGLFNIGSGQLVSMDELVGRIASRLDASVEPIYTHQPTLEYALWDTSPANCHKLQVETGWEPKVGLEEGIERVCSPYESPLP